MGLKAKIEAIIYAAEEPITIEQISVLVKDMVMAELAAELPAEPVVADTEPVAEQDVLVADATTPETIEAASSTDESVADAPAAEAAEAAPESTPDPTSEDAPVTDAALPAADAPVDASAPEPAVSEPAPLDSAAVTAPEPTRGKKKKSEKSDAPRKEPSEDARVRARIRAILEELIADYEREERGMEIRQVAGGYRMATKPEHHDVVRAFAKSLKPPVRLSLAALETLAVIAYKQPITVPEISEIRGVESGGVIGTLLDRKLITTAGRKQVIGRPILYKTSKEFLLRFGLNELAELPSMEEFEKLAADGQGELFVPEQATTEAATPTPETPVSDEIEPQPEAALSESPEAVPEQTPTTSEEQPEPISSEQSEVSAEPQAEVVTDAIETEPVADDTVAEDQASEIAEPEQADAARHE